VDLIFVDRDALGDRLHNLALRVSGKVSPTAVEVLGLGHDLVPGEVLDLPEVDLALETRQLVLDLQEPGLEGPVLPAETVDRERV